ncbi:MAG: competence/damage-inducible protein A [bacterium]
MNTAAIVIIGDEILHGETRDENGPWLIEQLNQKGIEIEAVLTLPDKPDRAVPLLKQVVDCDYVLITGGIGPTHDDLTRQMVAQALEKSMETNEQVLEWLHTYYGDRVNESRVQMANLPKNSNAILLEDSPAIAFRTDNVFVFPGFPSLLKPLFDQWKEKFEGSDAFSRHLTVESYEGDVAEPLSEIQEKYPECQIGSYPREDGHIDVKIRGGDQSRVQSVYEQIKTALT